MKLGDIGIVQELLKLVPGDIDAGIGKVQICLCRHLHVRIDDLQGLDSTGALCTCRARQCLQCAGSWQDTHWGLRHRQHTICDM